MLLNGMAHSRSPSVRQMALSLGGQWSRNGFAMVKQLMKDASREAGWTPEKMAAFDYDAWTFVYICSYNGLYTQLQHGFMAPEPSVERIAEAIHATFIRPLTKPAGEENSCRQATL